MKFGQQIEHCGGIAGTQPIPDLRRKRVDQAAFDTRRRQHAFSRAPVDGTIQPRQADRDGFQRFTREALAEMLAPGDIEAAIGRLHGGDAHASCLKKRNPRGIGPETRPARAAQRQDDGIGCDSPLAFRR